MKTASGFITHITLLAVAASALLSCTGNRGAEALLQRAEDSIISKAVRYYEKTKDHKSLFKSYCKLPLFANVTNIHF